MDIPLLIGALLIGVLALVVLFAALFKAGRKAIAKSDSTRTPGDRVEFVVSTFNELVEKLKAKEREIETLRSQAEARADRAAALTEDILRSVPSGVLTIDPEGLVTSVNPPGLAILGMKEEGVLGRPAADVFSGTPLGELLRRPKGSDVERGEAVFPRPGDAVRTHLGYTLSVLRDAEHNEIGALFTFADLTEVKRLEESVALKTRLAQLGETSAGIAHELRNPMAVLSGYLALLKKKEGLDEGSGVVVEKMAAEIKVMDRIISDLLAFTRAEPFCPAGVAVSSIVEESLAAASSRCEMSQIDVSREIPADLPLVWGDPDRLRQVFVNLLCNAVEAAQGRGSVEIEARALSAREISISVSDTGPGIPPEIRDKVFLPFFTAKDGGTGMGLAMVQKIVVSHGVQVEIGDRPGGGAVFTVRLPSWAPKTAGPNESARKAGAKA